jgi:drug/metabolite transporter, DME family
VRSSRLGLLAVAAAAVMWAASGTYGRTLIDRGASPLEITEARAWIAFIALGIVALVRRGRSEALDRESVPSAWVFVLFGLSLAAANYFYYSAIATLPIAVAVVIQYTAPGLVVLWLAAVERSKPSPRVIVALGSALVGVALLAELPGVLSGGDVSLAPRGVAQAAVSAVAFAVYILTGERVGMAVGPRDALLRGFGVASVLWIVVQASNGKPETLTDSSLLPGVVLLGFTATIIPFLLFVWGLERIGASRAGIVSTLEPLSAALFAAVFLDQRLDGLQLAGAALVVAAIAVVQSEQSTAVPTPAPVD